MPYMPFSFKITGLLVLEKRVLKVYPPSQGGSFNLIGQAFSEDMFEIVDNDNTRCQSLGILQAHLVNLAAQVSSNLALK